MLNPANQKFAGFFVNTKTPYYSPKHPKNERNSVPNEMENNRNLTP